MPALAKGVVDIALTPLNQTPADTQGVLGRILSLNDCQIRHYEPHYAGQAGVIPAKVRVDPRDAIVSLPSTARSVVDGTTATPTWSHPELLNSLGGQAISIANAIPRVWNGTNWSTYSNTRTLTQKTSEDVFHTSQHALQADTEAWLSGVTCGVWTESVTASTGPITTTYVGFKAGNGAWVVQPTVLLGPSAAGTVYTVKVVEDGSHFFVVYNDPVHTRYFVAAYDTRGQRLALGTVAATDSDVVKVGNWDIVAAVTGSPNTGTVILAQALSATSDAGVQFVSLGLSGSSITQHAHSDATLQCAGPLAWQTNDTGNGLTYLATLSAASEVFGYEISALAQVNEFGSMYEVATDNFTLDSIAGFAFVGDDGIDVTLSIGLLPAITDPPDSGPPVDPQLRFVITRSCDRSNNVATLRTTQSVCQVSKAFAIDGEYYVMAYYQSGSGIGILPVSQAVTITDGDYMIGAPVQPITIQAGDSTQGSPIDASSNSASFAGDNVYVSNSHVAVNINAGDFVNAIAAPAAFAAFGIPTGTTVLIWSFSGRAPTIGDQGSRITVTGSSVAGANDTWDVIAFDGSGTGHYITPITNATRSNTLVPIGNFTHAGNFTLVSLTAYVINDLSPYINTQTERFFLLPAATVTVTDSTHGNNVTGIRPQRVFYGQPGPNYISYGLSSWGGVWVLTGSQTGTIETFGLVLTPSSPNAWAFASGEFDSTYIGTDLVVSEDPEVPSNVGTYPVTSVPFANTVVTGGATAVIAQVFGFPFPTIAIQLTTQNPYTFKLQSITPDYTYQGALVSVQGAANPNNGTYLITQINADGTFIALPTNGLANQVNEAFTGSQTITIFFAQNIAPEFQPTWFLVPLEGTQAVVGRLENGLAYADWRVEIESGTPNLYPMSLSAPVTTTLGTQLLLPYRAQNVTAGVVEKTPAGSVALPSATFDSTVGLKTFLLANQSGQSFANNSELLIPGPMATVFSASGFLEDNVNLAPEEPFLVSQSIADEGQLALTESASFGIVTVWEATDEDGDRIYSPPSPELQVAMSGTNNVATYGGRLLCPLDASGKPAPGVFGPTTRNPTLALYRRAFINGVPTTQHYKITNDLNPNGLAPASTLNASGFAFPDTFTWNYLDQNPDATITANEILYTDKGLLPRYPAPASIGGVGSWRNREWVIGYDGAVWMSGEKTEGDAIWYHPAFRFAFSAEDKPKALAPMDSYLLVFCERSVWYIPAANFPDATGANGALPTPVRLPFQNGSANGFAITIREGVAYDSTAGGVWLITRSLDNVWLSHDVLDSLTSTVTGLALDSAQRLFVQQADGPLMVYDGIPTAWYEWVTPTQGVLLSTYNGQAAYQDSSTVNVVTPGVGADLVAGVTYGIAPDVTLAPLNIGNVRGLKRVWEFQIIGTYLGPHRLNVELSYPEDDEPTTLYIPFVPSADEPYVYPFNPKIEEASQFGIRIYADFVGVNVPGFTFSLEMISAEVGMDPVGLNKRPSAVRIIAR